MSAPYRPAYLEVAQQCAAKLRERAAEVDRAGTYPRASMDIVRDHGLLHAVAPTYMGGLDLGPNGDMWGYFRVLETLASGCSSTAQIVAVHYAAMATIKAIGHKDQLEKFAHEAATDGATFCYLGSEPSQRFTDAGGRPKYDSVATPVDGGWSVTADKFFATGSMGCTYIIPLCMAQGSDDMSGLLVPVVPAEAPGVEIIDSWDNMGQRATSSGVCKIKDAFVPHDMTIGAPGDFLKPGTIGQLFQLTFAALFNGIGQSALDFTIDYLKTCAKPVIGVERAVDEPHVAILIGDMSMKLEAGKALVRRAAEALSAVESGAASSEEASRAVYQAKCHCSQASVELGSMLFRLCGARATSRDFNADRFWRNARTLTLHDNLDRQLTATGRSVLGIADLKTMTR